MRIALITDEFPPDTPGGGIATYLVHAATMLSNAGHDVEVFAQSSVRDESEQTGAFKVHWIKSKTGQFATSVVARFASVHSLYPFDVFEASDYNAVGLEIKYKYPRLPYVVKLHTPLFTIKELHDEMPPILSRVRMHFGAARRGKVYRPRDFLGSDAAKREIQAILLADEIASPTLAIATTLNRRIGLPMECVSVFPYCFIPSPEFTAIDVSWKKNLVFVGRLEPRKGVLDLAKAFRILNRRHPEASLKVIGKASKYWVGGKMVDTRSKMVELLGESAKKVQFVGQVDRSQIPSHLADSSIAVFPSHWESFGLVCCEAMAAGLYVVGSSSGGMPEVLDNCKAGSVVPPKSPSELSKALDRACSNLEDCKLTADHARSFVKDHFSYERISKLQVASYQKAIDRASSN